MHHQNVSMLLKGPMNDWMTDDILVLIALRRKYESIWRKTRLTVHFDMYSERCMAVKKAISKSKPGILQRRYLTAMVIRIFFFKIVDTMLGRKKQTELHNYDSPLTMNTFFH